MNEPKSTNLKHSYRVIPGFERAAESYDDYAVLQRKVADEMLDRLREVKLKPAYVIDV